MRNERRTSGSGKGPRKRARETARPRRGPTFIGAATKASGRASTAKATILA